MGPSNHLYVQLAHQLLSNPDRVASTPNYPLHLVCTVCGAWLPVFGRYFQAITCLRLGPVSAPRTPFGQIYRAVCDLSGSCDSRVGVREHRAAAHSLRVGLSGERPVREPKRHRSSLPSSRTPSCCWFDHNCLRSPARSQVELPRQVQACSHGPVAAHSYRWNEPVTPAL